MTTATTPRPAYTIRAAHYTVPSHTDPTRAYRVTVDPADGLPVACQCLGFRHHRRCRHLAEATTGGYKLHVRLGLAAPARDLAAEAADLFR